MRTYRVGIHTVAAPGTACAPKPVRHLGYYYATDGPRAVELACAERGWPIVGRTKNRNTRLADTGAGGTVRVRAVLEA